MARLGVALAWRWLVGCSLVWLVSLPLGAQQLPFFVIVHPDNDTDMLSRQMISDIFLKKAQVWRDGSSAEPVDLDPASSIREAFSVEIHGRRTEQVKKYWAQKAFSGTQSPPVEVAGDAEAVAFVRANPASIAYVSTTAPLDGVKIVPVVIPPEVINRVPPEYPQVAARFRVQGDVVLRLEIDEDGKVAYVTVVKGLSHGLTEAAEKAVKKWRFKPATSGGVPVSAELDVTVSFRL